MSLFVVEVSGTVGVIMEVPVVDDVSGTVGVIMDVSVVVDVSGGSCCDCGCLGC